MKYKIVGSMNALIGFLQVGIASYYLFLVLPKLNVIYQQFDVDHRGSEFSSYAILSGIFLLGLINLFFALKNISGASSEKYFNYSVISLIISFVIGGFLVAYLVIASVGPMYLLKE